MSFSASTQPLVELPTQQLFICRQRIPSFPDILWRIERGAVRTVTWSEDNTFSGLGYWGPGDIVGHFWSVTHVCTFPSKADMQSNADYV